MTLDALGRPDDIGWISGSALSGAMKCAASGVLWRVLGAGGAASRIGSALHDHLRQRAAYGVTTAVEMLGDVARTHELDADESDMFIARAKSFDWSPPAGAISEQALCLFEDGRVEAVKGGKGQYDGLPADALIPAQIDLFWAEPEPLYRDASGRVRCPPGSTLWVIDFKSGKEDYVEDAERNPQALASAVLAAKWTGAKRVLPGIVFIRRGEGIWDVPEHALDEAGIARVADLLKESVLAVRTARAAHRRGLPLIYREGAHCNMCRARHACPAHLATLKAWLDDPGPIEPGALSGEQLRELAAIAPAIRAFTASIDAALHAHVQATREPIPMGDGRVYGPYAKPRTKIDADKAVAALVPEIGAERAASAFPRKLSVNAMKEAIQKAHAEDGKVKTAGMAFKRTYARLAGSGGIEQAFDARWGVHKPAKVIELAARQRVIASLEGIPIDGDDEGIEGDE